MSVIASAGDRRRRAKRLARRILTLPAGAEKDQAFDELAVLVRDGSSAKDSVDSEEGPRLVEILIHVVSEERLVESYLGSRSGGSMSDPHEIDEVKQRADISWAGGLQGFQFDEAGPPGQFKRWLFTYVGWRRNDHLRDKYRRREVTINEFDEQGRPLSSLVVQASDVLQAMAHLPPRYRRYLELYYFDDLTAAEIQATLGIEPTQYRNLRRNAMQNLLAVLGTGYRS